MRLLFSLMTGSAGLLEDKKRMVGEERCAMCDSGVGEDVAHFLVGCGKIDRNRLCCKMMCAELCRPGCG